MKTLETPRLLLRPFTLEDAEAAHREIYSDIEVVQYYSGQGVQTLEQVRTRIASCIGVWASDELGRYAVILKEHHAFIGQIHLNSYVNSFARWNDEPDPPFNSLEVELAFAFGRRFWGQGYAFEACRAVIGHAFDDLRLRRLVGWVFLANERSVTLHRRLGFRVELSVNPADPGYVTILENGCEGLWLPNAEYRSRPDQRK
jgi:ribosomal-protein-alanine N-acetyltransferase